MGDAYFYHLTQSQLDTTLVALLDRALAQGWRIAIRGRERAQLEWLDERLWLWPQDRFLPHGRAGGAHDARQPILLTEQKEAVNAPHCVMAIDGVEISTDELQNLERLCVLFDGNDEEATQRARDQWQTLTQNGVRAKYWSEASGKWEMKAQSGT